jgi:exodeoxyribonuclease VII large subunit
MRRRGITTLSQWGEENRRERFEANKTDRTLKKAPEKSADQPSRQILSVSDLSSIVSSLLTVPPLTDIWVRGEVRNAKRSGGHLYFTLSEHGDQDAIVSCKMWKFAAGRLSFSPEDGMAVLAYGTIQCYAPHGSYSLIINDMQADGAGDKHLLLERWKHDLSEEGLFSHERKRALPRYPRRIGVVTSPTGAVFHDIKNVIKNRFPLELVLSPTSVQGSDAHTEISAAIERLQDSVDLIIIGRGGGSFEDLFPFNHPDVVRSIAAAPVPIISAIGHEVDITLADLVADVRASTPSHAAELAVPDRASEMLHVQEYKKRFRQLLQIRLEHAFEYLNHARERFLPITLMRGLMTRQEKLADQAERLKHAVFMQHDAAKRDLLSARAEMKAYNPATHFSRQIKERKENLITVLDHLHATYANHLCASRSELQHLLSLIKAHDPRAPFTKGYCFVKGPEGFIIKSVREITVGSDITMTCADGTATATVTSIDILRRMND